jgi:hypothetical protein
VGEPLKVGLDSWPTLGAVRRELLLAALLDLFDELLDRAGGPPIVKIAAAVAVINARLCTASPSAVALAVKAM